MQPGNPAPERKLLRLSQFIISMLIASVVVSFSILVWIKLNTEKVSKNKNALPSASGDNGQIKPTTSIGMQKPEALLPTVKGMFAQKPIELPKTAWSQNLHVPLQHQQDKPQIQAYLSSVILDIYAHYDQQIADTQKANTVTAEKSKTPPQAAGYVKTVPTGSLNVVFDSRYPDS